jgi:hypothetical protein
VLSWRSPGPAGEPKQGTRASPPASQPAAHAQNFPPLVFKARTSEHSGARDPRGFQSGGPKDWGAQTLVRAGETVALDSSFFFFARFFG